jgi:HEPN domain-containing protein
MQSMIDISKQIEFWRAGSREDFVVAQELIGRGRIRHGLFFLHLSLEKAIKAHVCRTTGDLAPRIHNLVRLTELAGMQLSQERFDTLAEMNAFNIEGRYPDLSSPSPTSTEAQNYLIQAEGILKWLNSRS